MSSKSYRIERTIYQLQISGGSHRAEVYETSVERMLQRHL